MTLHHYLVFQTSLKYSHECISIMNEMNYVYELMRDYENCGFRYGIRERSDVFTFDNFTKDNIFTVDKEGLLY